MKKYIGSKIIKAIPMTNQEFNAEKRVVENSKHTLEVYENGGCVLRPNQSPHCFSEQDNRGRQEKQGYKILYPDGYISWSPKEAFEFVYREISPNEFNLIGA